MTLVDADDRALFDLLLWPLSHGLHLPRLPQRPRQRLRGNSIPYRRPERGANASIRSRSLSRQDVYRAAGNCGQRDYRNRRLQQHEHLGALRQGGGVGRTERETGREGQEEVIGVARLPDS